jgi:uncharacterized protein with PQ loop repeat
VRRQPASRHPANGTTAWAVSVDGVRVSTGWFTDGLSCVIGLPQVVRAIRAKHLDGISSATYWLVLANAAAWTAWSLFTGEYAAGVPALVNGPVAIVILHRLAVGRHDTPDPRVQQ